MSDNPTSGPDQGFGAYLQKAREQAGKSLDDLARATSVRRTYLEALEQEDLANLPEDVYARNFVRLYARAVGIDGNDALERFSQLRQGVGSQPAVTARPVEPSPPPPAVGTPAAPSELAPPPTREMSQSVTHRAPRPVTQPAAPITQATPTDARRPVRGDEIRRTLINMIPMLLTIVVAGALVGGAVWGFNRLLDLSTPTPVVNTPAAPAASGDTTGSAEPIAPGDAATEPAEPATDPQAETQPSDALADDDLLALIPEDVLLTIETDPPGAQVSVDAFALPGITPITDAPVSARAQRTLLVELDGYLPYETMLDLTRDRDLQVTLEPIPSAEPSESTPAATGDVVVEVRERTWLEAYQSTARGEGVRLVYTTAQPGERFVFSRPVYLHLGNAGGVTVLIDGESIPPLGSSGAVLGRAFPEPQP